MAIYVNNKQVSIDNDILETRLQAALSTLQDRHIVFEDENILLTTALQRINERAKGKANIVVAETLPATTQPNTQYWVKTYDGQTLTDGCFIIITDNTNVAHYVGTSEVDLSDYLKTDALQERLNNNYYYGWYNQTENKEYYTRYDISGVELSIYEIAKDAGGRVTAITEQEAKGTINTSGDLEFNDAAYMRYTSLDGFYAVKGEEKILTVNTANDMMEVAGRVNDVKMDDVSIVKNKIAKMESTTETEITDLFKGIPNSGLNIIDMIYPVGSIICNNGTDPSNIYGGTTWEKYITGTQVLYGADEAGTTVNEELPNIKGEITKAYWGGTLIPQPNGAFANSVTNDYDWQGAPTDQRKGMLTKLDFKASNYSSVYKDNGKVRVAGKTVCYWIRTK